MMTRVGGDCRVTRRLEKFKFKNQSPDTSHDLV